MTLTKAEAALYYHQQGYTIIPCIPNTKKAAISWEKYKTEIPTEEQIKKWWSETPDANVAAVTGKNFMVVDIDSYKDIGINEKQAFNLGPTNSYVRTPRGGYHFYYKNGDTGNASNKLLGIDIRGKGGIVLLPPSTIDSKEYKWAQRKDGKMGEYPVDLIDFIGKKERILYENKWITDILTSSLADGDGRDNAAVRLAGYCINKGIPNDITMEILSLWNRQNQDPLPKQILEEKIYSVNRMREMDVIQDNKFDLIHLDDFIVTNIDSRPSWIVKDWILDSSLHMITAPPGSYKSWLCYDLAVAVASNTFFLNNPVDNSGPVFIVQQEDPKHKLAERIQTIYRNKLKPLENSENEISYRKELPVYLYDKRDMTFENGNLMNGLREKIKLYRPKLIILDPLYSFMSVDDNLSGASKEFLKLKNLRDEFGCTFLVVHHARKNDPSGGLSRSSVWGSVFVDAAREAGWALVKPKEISEPNKIKLRRHFKEAEEYPPIDIEFNINTDDTYGSIIYEAIATDETPVQEEVGTNVVYTLIQENGIITTSDLQKQLPNQTFNQIQEQLKYLIDTDMIVQRGQSFAVNSNNILNQAQQVIDNYEGEQNDK